MTTPIPAPAPEGRPATAREVFTAAPQLLTGPYIPEVHGDEDDDREAGLLAEQNHQYYDLDPDSACCPDGPKFGCRSCLPHGEVTA